jgi:hypothetical protein
MWRQHLMVPPSAAVATHVRSALGILVAMGQGASFHAASGMHGAWGCCCEAGSTAAAWHAWLLLCLLPWLPCTACCRRRNRPMPWLRMSCLLPP